MARELEFTGERFTPECEREIWYEHVHRYAFAATLCSGRSVLDAACGEGYGSALLAATAREVTGVDVAEEAVTHARQRYAGIDGLRFQAADCTRLPFDDGQFERVVSFETIEHVEGQSETIAEFARVLDQNGVLILSSPDRAVYSDQHGNDNPFHVRELYRAELQSLLAEQFPHVLLLGQKLLFHSAIWALEGGGRVALQHWKQGGVSAQGGISHAPMYFIALCAHRAESLPALDADLWLFDDAEESVYTHYLGEIRRNMAAGGIIAEREREIERLRRQLAGAADAAPWYRRWFGRSR